MRLRTVQALAPPIVSLVLQGKAIVTSTLDKLGWVNATFFKDNSTAEITDGFRRSDFDVELGLVFQIDYEVNFKFTDTFKSSETAFFEFYVIQNRSVIHYQRFPDSGYITQPNSWFDDSMSRKIQGSVYIGASAWPCKNETDDLMMLAVVWKDSFQYHRTAPERADKHWVDRDVGGTEIGLAEGNWKTMGLTLLSKAEDTMRVTVMNPYYVEVESTDNDSIKGHHEAAFVHEFRATMHYSRSYPQIPVIDPSSADVTIEPLDSKDGWIFSGGPTAFSYEEPAHESREDVDIAFSGRHESGERHHAGGESFARVSYADDWGASIKGNAAVYLGESGTKVPQVFEWGAQFRTGPHTADCTPISFSVADTDPHEIPTPTPTPTETPPPPPMVEVRVLIYQGERFSLEQFNVADPDACGSRHYHPGFPGPVFSLEGGTATDPAPPQCGFGTVGRTTLRTVRVTESVWQDYRNALAGGGN